MSTFNISNFRSQVFSTGLARNNRFEVVFDLPAGIDLMPKYKTVYNPPNASIFQQIGNVLGTVGAIGGIIKNKGIGSLIATNAISAITGAAKDSKISLSDGRKVSLLCESASFPTLNISTKSQRIFGPAYQRVITSEYGGEGISLTFHVDRDMVVKRLFDAWMESIVAGGLAPGYLKNSYTVAYPKEYQVPLRINQLDEADNVIYSVELEGAFPKSMNLMDLNNSSQNQTHRLSILFAYRRWTPVPPSTR